MQQIDLKQTEKHFEHFREHSIKLILPEVEIYIDKQRASKIQGAKIGFAGKRKSVEDAMRPY
jgi:hypothetical protein